MKSIFRISATALLVFSFSACLAGIRGSGNLRTETRSVERFSSVDLAMSGKLIIEQSGDESLSVEAEDNLLGYITTEVRGDRLVIGTKSFVNFRSTKPIIFRLGVKNLEEVVLSGSGEVESGDLRTDSLVAELSGSGSMSFRKISTRNFKLKESGSGSFSARQIDCDDIEMITYGSGGIAVGRVESQNLTAQVNSSGSVELAGHVDKQEVKVAGSGSYSAAGLMSDEASIAVSGSGSVDLNVDKLLIANISGSGSVSYTGEPQVRETVSGSGTIIKRQVSAGTPRA